MWRRQARSVLVLVLTTALMLISAVFTPLPWMIASIGLAVVIGVLVLRQIKVDDQRDRGLEGLEDWERETNGPKRALGQLRAYLWTARERDRGK